MPLPKIQFNAEQVRKKMKTYERVCGKEISQQVKNWGRYCAVELAKATPPRGMDARAKKIGERAITKDVRSIFVALNDYWMDQHLAVNGGGTSKVRELYNKQGRAFVTDTMTTLYGYSDVAAFHKKSRSKKTGRPSQAGSWSKDIGRSKGKNVGVALNSHVDKLLKNLMLRIGLAKSAWITTAGKLGADTKAASTNRGIPAWVKRHLGKIGGNVMDNTKNRKHPHVVFASGLPYMSNILSASSRDYATKWARAKFMKSLNSSIRAELKKAKGQK
jgi:hypothetical protein